MSTGSPWHDASDSVGLSLQTNGSVSIPFFMEHFEQVLVWRFNNTSRNGLPAAEVSISCQIPAMGLETKVAQSV